MRTTIPKLAALYLAFALAALPALSRSQGAAFDPVAVRKAVDDFMAIQIKDLPGEASYTIGSIADNSSLKPCRAYTTSMVPGANLLGRTSVSVRCTEGANWTLQIPVHVRVVTGYLVSARPLSPGVALARDDIAIQRGDLGALPTGVLTDPAQAVGRVSRSALPAGRPLRADMLRNPIMIRQGQSVRITSRGPGFEVANEGVALGNAAAGEMVQVRLGSGQVVRGVVNSGGNVEISH